MIWTENKQAVGKVDEVLGPIDNFLFSIDLQEGMEPASVIISLITRK